MVVPRGINPKELENGGHTSAFNGSGTTGFKKKKAKFSNLYFWIGAGVIMLVIIALLIVALKQVKTGH